MARVEQRSAGTARRQVRSYQQYQMNTYVDGNTVRKVQPAQRHEEPSRANVSTSTRKNREKALQMNVGYVLFLTAAAVMTVIVCINYLKLQAQYTTYQKSVTSLGTQYSELKLENDSEYNRILASVDLSQLKDTAINRLGMVYASENQIHTYNSMESDYVIQYQGVPTE